MLADVAIQRMDNVGIVVDDLDAAVAFFAELGMELEGKGQVEGLGADRTVGLDGVRSEIAMMRTPDGHGKLELSRYHAPAAGRAGSQDPPPNTLGLHRVMFAVDDIDDTVARLRAHGAELLGEVAQYESIFLLCYLRGPAASSSPWPSRSADASLLRDRGRTLTGARGRSPGDPHHCSAAGALPEIPGLRADRACSAWCRATTVHQT